MVATPSPSCQRKLASLASGKTDSDPSFRWDDVHKSLRQFAQRALARGHDLARRRHLLLEIRLPADEFDTIGLEHQRQLVPNLPVEMRQHLLRQDDPGGISDPGDPERLVHTGVITNKLWGDNRAG